MLFLKKSYKNRIIIFLLLLVSLSSCFKEEFGGLGIQVPSGDDRVTEDNPFIVLAVVKGGTADSYGIRSGDIITSVDDTPLQNKKQSYIVKSLIRGKVGTIVLLKIKREGNPMVFRIPRGNIILEE